jgi:hypothetical protein
MQNVASLHFRYYAANAVTIKYSLDGETTYHTFTATLPATTSGVDWEWKEVAFGKECKSISIDFLQKKSVGG